MTADDGEITNQMIVMDTQRAESSAPISDTQAAMEMAIKAHARLRLSISVRLTAWAFVTGNKETSWEAYVDLGENKGAKILTAPTLGQLAPLLEEYEP